MSRDDVLENALAWSAAGERVAIATVIDTWGSSPRPRGSELAVREDGLFVGSVSGGCVEGKVVEAAIAAMKDGSHRLLEFGVSNEEAWGVGLACGGAVRVFVAPLDSRALAREVIARAFISIEKNRPIVIAHALDGSGARIIAPNDATLSIELREAASRVLTNDSAERITEGAREYFLLPKNPPRKLLVVGAVHIAEALAQIATLLSYDVTLIDPRSAFTREERWRHLARLRVLAEWPDEAIAKWGLDARTAVVALTHDPKIDDVALEAALKSDAFYVGALGSKKTHAARIARFVARGFSLDLLDRIRGPVGLAIGAKSPSEIAVSIAAEMTASLRGARVEPR